MRPMLSDQPASRFLRSPSHPKPIEGHSTMCHSCASAKILVSMTNLASNILPKAADDGIFRGEVLVPARKCLSLVVSELRQGEVKNVCLE